MLFASHGRLSRVACETCAASSAPSTPPSCCGAQPCRGGRDHPDTGKGSVQSGQKLGALFDQPQRQSGRPLSLCAVAESSDTPVTEVFTVVGQQPVVPFAQARAGAVYDFPGRIGAGRVFHDPDGMTYRKAEERHLLDRTCPPAAAKAGVVHDLPVTHVHAMMVIADARCFEVCSEGRLAIPGRGIETKASSACWNVLHRRPRRDPVAICKKRRCAAARCRRAGRLLSAAARADRSEAPACCAGCTPCTAPSG